MHLQETVAAACFLYWTWDSRSAFEVLIRDQQHMFDHYSTKTIQGKWANVSNCCVGFRWVNDMNHLHCTRRKLWIRSRGDIRNDTVLHWFPCKTESAWKRGFHSVLSESTGNFEHTPHSFSKELSGFAYLLIFVLFVSQCWHFDSFDYFGQWKWIYWVFFITAKASLSFITVTTPQQLTMTHWRWTLTFWISVLETIIVLYFLLNLCVCKFSIPPLHHASPNLIFYGLLSTLMPLCVFLSKQIWLNNFACWKDRIRKDLVQS